MYASLLVIHTCHYKDYSQMLCSSFAGVYNEYLLKVV